MYLYSLFSVLIIFLIIIIKTKFGKQQNPQTQHCQCLKHFSGLLRVLIIIFNDRPIVHKAVLPHCNRFFSSPPVFICQKQLQQTLLKNIYSLFIYFGCIGSQSWHLLLQLSGLVTLWHLGSQFSEQGSNQCPPCIGRWILNHWTTRKVPI